MLNFLRSGDLPPREHVRAVHKEAQYYAIGPLLEQLENMQPLKGEKVRQAFLGLMPYYKGEGSAASQLGKGVTRHHWLPGLSQEWAGPMFIQIRRKCSPLSMTMGVFKLRKMSPMYRSPHPTGVSLLWKAVVIIEGEVCSY